MAVLSSRNKFGTQVLMVLCFSSLAAGFNATAPRSDDQPVGWQAGGHQRGTWAIISNCLSTIFACTWTIQHLNVPGKRTSDSKWDLKFRSCKWMLFNILFPEFIVLRAAFELLMAMKALNQMAENGKDVAYPWWYHRHLSLSTLVRQFLGLWRSFRGTPSSSDPHDGRDSEKQEPDEDRKWTLTQCFFANSGGFYYEDRASQFPLTALQIAAEQSKFGGRFDRPENSEEDIQDKSKQDWFIKIIAALQFSQLALSLIVRTNQGHAYSQLEAITLGFAVCGIIFYLIYLDKPQNVQVPFKVEMGVADGGPIRYKKTFESFWEILTNKETDSADGTPVDRIKNDSIPVVRDSSVHPAVFLLALTSGLFGAIHAIAWNFEFPTAVEKTCWQTATVVAAGSPMAGLITIPFAQWTVPSGDPQRFIVDCLRLLREYSWHTDDKDEVDKIYDGLEQIHIKIDTDDDDAKKLYKDIFSVSKNPPHFRDRLLKFIKDTEDLRKTPLVDLHPDFVEHFRNLCNLMEDKGAKKLRDSAKTNVFPRKNLLPKACNLTVLVLTSSLYVLARLTLLAISISSLRRMPKSVYTNTPWTKYIPTLGSMS